MRGSAGIPSPPSEVAGSLSGKPYGIDLGATFDGEIFVACVDPASAADRAGVRQGDLLPRSRSVGRNVVEAQRQLDGSWEDCEINLSVRREGRETFITVGRR